MFYQRPSSKIMAVLLSVALIMCIMPLWAFATENGGSTLGESGVVISAFDELAEEVQFQVYGSSEELEDISLPESLTGTDEEDNSITINDITWQRGPSFTGTIASSTVYQFTAVLPEGYSLAAGVTAPVITVMIGQRAVSSLAFSGGSAADIGAYIQAWAHGGTGSFTVDVTGNTVTVSGGVMGASEALRLTIDNNVAVNWNATLGYSAGPSASALVILKGNGTFDLQSGGELISGDAIETASVIEVSGGALELKVSGGKIDYKGWDKAISLSDSAVFNMSSGDITAHTDSADGGIIVAEGNTKINVSGGTVEHRGANASATMFALHGGAEFVMTGGDMKTDYGRGIYFYADGGNSGNRVTVGNIEITGGSFKLIGANVRNVIYVPIYSSNNIHIGGNAELVCETEIDSGTAGMVIISGRSTIITGGTLRGKNPNGTFTGLDAVSFEANGYAKGIAVLWNQQMGTHAVGATTDLTEKTSPYGDGGLSARWGIQDGQNGIRVTNAAGTESHFVPVSSVTVTKASNTAPQIEGGNIVKRFGDHPFTITATGGEGTGAYEFSSSNPAVATVDENGLVTLGLNSAAIGSTNITVKKLGDGEYNDSPASAHITLTVNKGAQAVPKFTYTRSGDAETGYMITITGPDESNMEFSKDSNFSTPESSNQISFPAGATSGDIYVRLKATDVYEASSAAHIALDFSKEDQEAPPAFDLTTRYNPNTKIFTVSVPPVSGVNNMEYSFDGVSYSDLAEVNSTTATLGETVTAYVRYKASATHNASNVTVSTLKLPLVPVTKITVVGEDGADSITTRKGSLQLHVQVEPENADNKAVTWSVIGSAATIDENGLLTATGEHDDNYVMVTATAADGTQTKSSMQRINISGQTVITVTGASGANAITTPGGQLQMQADIEPASAANKALTWTVSGASAEISSTGMLTAKSNGTVVVRAALTENNNIYGEKEITISDQDTTPPTVLVASITVTGAGGANSITVKDGTLQMSANVQPDNASNKAVNWTVSNNAVATISSTGMLTAKANGTITVRATAADGSGKYGEKVITISGQDTTAPVVPVDSISISGGDRITAKGGSLNLTANVLPANASNKMVNWTVSNNAVATITGTGTLTARANGTVTVRATAADGSGKYGEKVITISGQDTTVPVVPVTASLLPGWAARPASTPGAALCRWSPLYSLPTQTTKLLTGQSAALRQPLTTMACLPPKPTAKLPCGQLRWTAAMSTVKKRSSSVANPPLAAVLAVALVVPAVPAAAPGVPVAVAATPAAQTKRIFMGQTHLLLPQIHPLPHGSILPVMPPSPQSPLEKPVSRQRIGKNSLAPLIPTTQWMATTFRCASPSTIQASGKGKPCSPVMSMGRMWTKSAHISRSGLAIVSR